MSRVATMETRPHRVSAATVMALLALATACGDNDQDATASSAGDARSSTAVAAADSSATTGACEILTALVAVESRTDFEDPAAMREAAPITAGLLAQLTDVAPEQLADDVDILSDAVDDWRATIEDPAFVLDPDTYYIWQTAQSQDASQTLSAWAEENCPAGIDTEALQPVTLVLCLPSDADADDVQALFARTSTPSDTGTGEDLLDGIQSVSARQRGIEVELSHLVSPERKTELVAILGAPPVVEVIEGGGSCE